MPQFNAYPPITSPQPDDLLLIFQDSSGSVKTVTVDNFADAIGDIIGASIGAPVTAKYILQSPNAELSSAQSLSELGTGLLKSTTGTGVLSIASPGSDYLATGIITSSGLTTISGVVLGRVTGGTGAIEALTTLPLAVQNNISRLGTIISGVWNGTAIDLGVYGGGTISVNRFDSGTNANAGTWLNGAGQWTAPPGSGTVTHTEGDLDIDQLIVGNGLGDSKTLAAGTDGHVLTMVAGIPAWAAGSSSSGTVNSAAINRLAYYAATGTTVSGLATSGNGILVTDGSGVPTITNILPPTITVQSGGDATLNINTDGGGNSSLLRFLRGGSQKSVIAVAPADGYIIGSADNDTCYVAVSKSHLFSVDNGASIALAVLSGGGQVSAEKTTNATNTTNGALRTKGGLSVASDIVTGGSIKTGTPSGGTAAAWKFGVAAAVSPTSQNTTIELDIGGTTYYLTAKTTND